MALIGSNPSDVVANFVGDGNVTPAKLDTSLRAVLSVVGGAGWSGGSAATRPANLGAMNFAAAPGLTNAHKREARSPVEVSFCSVAVVATGDAHDLYAIVPVTMAATAVYITNGGGLSTGGVREGELFVHGKSVALITAADPAVYGMAARASLGGMVLQRGQALRVRVDAGGTANPVAAFVVGTALHTSATGVP